MSTSSTPRLLERVETCSPSPPQRYATLTSKMAFHGQVKHHLPRRVKGIADGECPDRRRDASERTTSTGTRCAPLDRKPFVCKDYRPRCSYGRPRGLHHPPLFVDTIELTTGRMNDGKFFCRDTSTSRHNGSSRRVRCVGARRSRRVSRPRCTGVVLRSLPTFGDGAGTAALGKVVVVDHPQRVGEQRSGGLHLDQARRPRRHRGGAIEARSMSPVRPHRIGGRDPVG